MRNRGLHDALRGFALEAAALLTDDQRGGAELEFDVEHEASRRGPALYNYRPLTGRFIAERWSRLRQLETCQAAADALGAGASAWLQVNGLRGAQAEPALQAMLERLYEEATGFGFPEERFERVYGEVERTLYRDTVGWTVIAGLPGLELESDRIDLGGGLSLTRDGALEPPVEDEAVCMLERDVAADSEGLVAEARDRFSRLLTGLRLFKPGAIGLAAYGWRRAGDGRWLPVDLGGGGAARGAPWTLFADEEEELRDFLELLDRSPQTSRLAWAIERFEMGCSRRLEADALSDYLLCLRALLDVTGGSGTADLGLRLAALCAEEGHRRGVRRRVELALTLERYVMGGGRGEELGDWIGGESPHVLVEEVERHARALLRDVVCGYLDADLKSIADDILLETPEPLPPDPPLPEPPPGPAEPEPARPPEPLAISARDLRREERIRASEPETVEFKALEHEEPADSGPRFARERLEGVTPSADWDEYSAPV
jgi:hypothetical protein